MKKQWKTLDNTRRPAVQPKLIGWIRDKDNRSLLGWVSSLLGISFIAGYQLTIGEGFTPDINLGEGALVLGKSAFVGLAVFLALYLGIFAPASSLRMLEIDVEKYEELPLVNIVKSVIRRCIFSQVFGGFFPAAVLFFQDTSKPFHFWAGFVYSVLSVLALIFALRSPRLPSEHAVYFYFSIFVIGLFACFSLFLFLLISGFQDKPESLALVSVAWLGLALISAILSVVRRKELLPSSVGALLILICLLASLGRLEWPFHAIANIVGISQPGPVTLVVPQNTCLQLRSALADVQSINCSTAEVGVLKNVELLNSWGKRWLIRITHNGKIRTLSFDGAGTIIVSEKVM